jgi:leader peptidase (prepilin peptidase)/N-methyltransferase
MISLFIGFFIGAVAGILLILLKIRNRDDLVPFGPFIVLGSFITLLWGKNILSWYLGF